MKGIVPGAYHAYAWSQASSRSYLDPEFMKIFQGRGTPVQIGKGQRLSVDLKILEAN